MANNKVALCIGATNGIGKAIAVHFAKNKANVIVAGRSLEAGASVLNELKQVHPGGSHSFLPCDASLMNNIKTFCQQFEQKQSPLHYLVMTQSIATMKGRDETSEGIDKKLALHYYGRIQFILSLLPILSRTAKTGEDVRVMSILSAGVHRPYTNLDDLELKRNFSLSNAANASGYYNDLGLDRLALDHPDLTFIHAAPGMVKSAWGTDLPLPFRFLVRVLQQFATPAEVCAEHMCAALFDKNRRGGLRLVGPRSQDVARTKLHNDDIRDKVWSHTLEVLQRVKPIGK